MQPTPPPPSPSTGLPRVLGFWIATAIIIGTVIGSGVFVKGRKVANSVDEFWLVMAVWVLGGVLALLGSLALAEIATLFPRAGGNYIFLREGYGRMAGFLWGWVEFWVIRGASAAALATVFTDSFHDVLRQSLYPHGVDVLIDGEIKRVAATKVDVLTFWPRQLMTVLVLVGLSALNIRGTLLSGAVQFGITVLKVVSILFIIVLPFAVYVMYTGHTHPPRTANLSLNGPKVASNLAGIGPALIAVLWAYNGWMNIAPVAGEVKNPQRNIPLSLLTGVFVLIVLYCSAQVAYHLVLPRDVIIAKDAKGELSKTPLSTEFMSVLIGPAGVLIASAIVMTSVLGALNGNILVGPRLLYAMGQDKLAPSSWSRLHAKYQTPAMAIAVLCVWSCVLVVFVGALTQYKVMPVFETSFGKLDLNVPEGKSPFDIITDFVIFGSVTFETLAVATIFVFRKRIPPTPENRPYRCWGYPVVPGLYVAIMALVLVNYFVNPDSRSEAFGGIAFIGSGAVAYWLFFKNRKA